MSINKQHTRINVNCEDCTITYCKVCYLSCPNCLSLHIKENEPIKWKFGDPETSNPNKYIPLDRNIILRK